MRVRGRKRAQLPHSSCTKQTGFTLRERDHLFILLSTESQPLINLFRMAGRVVPHLMTLADLSPSQINGIVSHAHYLKHVSLPWLSPQQRGVKTSKLRMPSQSLFSKSIALLFSKRSTRTRLSAETAAILLGGKALFLGRDDIQLGVNESTRDTARVIGGMCQGIFARVGDHSEIEVSTACLVCIPRLNAKRVM